jgi:drug/metabolite transporter (DMT)-like permease
VLYIAFPFASKYSLADYLTGWLPLGIVLGMFFISLFFLIGLTTQKMGASVTTVAMKLGYVIPIFLAFTYYHETATSIKIIGIFLTILAVFFTSYKKDPASSKFDYKLFFLPFIIFVGSGIADAIVQNVNNRFFSTSGSEMFVLITFLVAFLAGFIVAIYKNIQTKTNHFTKKNIVAGILLGLPNYFSMYFLFKALNVPTWEDSFVFPVNNIGIVVLSSLLAVLLFKEKLNSFNIVGLLLAVISILILNLNNIF